MAGARNNVPPIYSTRQSIESIGFDLPECARSRCRRWIQTKPKSLHVESADAYSPPYFNKFLWAAYKFVVGEKFRMERPMVELNAHLYFFFRLATSSFDRDISIFESSDRTSSSDCTPDCGIRRPRGYFRMPVYSYGQQYDYPIHILFVKFGRFSLMEFTLVTPLTFSLRQRCCRFTCTIPMAWHLP